MQQDYKRHYIRRLPFLGMLLLGFLVTFIVTAAGRDSSYYYLKRTFDLDDIVVRQPVGLAYSSADDVLIVINETVNGRDVALITRQERLADAFSMPAIDIDPINMAFDAQTNSLYLLEQNTQELVQIQVNLKEQPGSASEVIKRFDLGSLGLSQVQGITLDPNSGQLYVLDGDLSRLVGLTPDAQQGFDGALALDQGRVSQRGLRGLGNGQPRGIAFNSSNNHLFILSASNQRLTEMTESGQTVATYDLSPLELENPTGMVVAPSGDATDDPSIMSLYITDSGEILELSFTEPIAIPVPQAVLTSILVNTIDNSAWSPASPDTSGIQYIPTAGNFLISDSEVNEMKIFTGDNLYRSTLAGNLITSFSSLSFSNEPTGLGWNPNNGHLYVSDDTGTRGVYDVYLGPDGDPGTLDDTFVEIESNWYGGGNDPEGVAYGQGKLFIMDGVNEEVYIVDPGPNGVFESNDQFTSFDTTILGARDPEGIDFK